MEKQDCEMVRELFNDPEIENLVVGWAFPLSSYAQEKWFENHYADNTNFRFVIETPEDGAACTHRQCLFMRGFEPFVAGLQIFGQQPEIAAVQVLAVGDGVEVGLSFGCLFDRGAYCAVHFVYQVPGKVHSR